MADLDGQALSIGLYARLGEALAAAISYMRRGSQRARYRSSPYDTSPTRVL
jgi:hypothetical protein